MSEFLSELVGWKKVYTPLCILITFAVVLYTINVQNGKLLPDFGKSLLESLNIRSSNRTWSTEHSSPSSCGVCLMVKVGDDGWQPPSEKNLPFLLLPRLFEAVQNLTNNSPTLLPDPKSAKKVCVGMDYPSIVCKMVRDSLGPEANCWNYTQIIHQEGGVRIRCDDMVVGNTSRFVNQMSIAGARSFRWQRMHLVDLDTVEKSPELGRTHDEVRVDQAAGIMRRPTIVTGFSENHLSAGLLLLRSIGRGAQDARINHLRPEFNVSVVVWTMERFVGKDADDLRCVVAEMNEKWKVPTEVREFDFSAYPLWMQINQTLGYFGGTGEYAWKAVMIHRVLVERGFAHWQDAGCRFKTTASLTETLDYTAKHGFASRGSSGAIWDWTFPAQLQFLRAASVDTSTGNCDASSIGFTLERYKELIQPWYECSLIRQCIAPDGSDRSNHRQDQAALTVLAALSNNKCQGIHAQVGVHMDNNLGNLKGANHTSCYEDPRRTDNNGR